jgi:uncharacterized protein
MNREFLFSVLREQQEELKKRGVKSLAVFGSVARGDFNELSDLDLLVEFERPVGLFEFIRLKMYLEQMTGRGVDLVTPDAVRQEMCERILGDAIYVC